MASASKCSSPQNVSATERTYSGSPMIWPVASKGLPGTAKRTSSRSRATVRALGMGNSRPLGVARSAKYDDSPPLTVKTPTRRPAGRGIVASR